MRDPSNRRLILASIFFVLTILVSGAMVDRAEANHCFKCGVCRPFFEPCCKIAQLGGKPECDDGAGTCVLSGVTCTH